MENDRAIAVDAASGSMQPGSAEGTCFSIACAKRPLHPLAADVLTGHHQAIPNNNRRRSLKGSVGLNAQAAGSLKNGELIKFALPGRPGICL